MISAKDHPVNSFHTDATTWVLLFACWIVGAMAQLVKFFHGKAGIAVLAGAICVATLLWWLRSFQAISAGQIRWSWLIAFWAFLTILYLILYPIAQRHIVGVGSDSEDALRVAVTQLLHRHYPYRLRTYLGNQITPMPGALFLAIPFYLMGRVSLQNLAWLAAFIFFCGRYFRLRSTALVFLLLFALGSACTLDAFAVGDDYVTNAWYVCFAVFFFLRTYEEDPNGWQHTLLGVLLGVTLSSRPAYVVIPPLVLASLLQCGRGTLVALRSFALPLLVAIAVTIPFYVYDPLHFSPLHIQTKLNFLPPHERTLLIVSLPLLAILAACSGFFMRLTTRRLFLIAGISIGIILLLPGLILCLLDHFAPDGWGLLSYGVPAVMFVGLWALSEFEVVSQVTGGASPQSQRPAPLPVAP